MAEVSQGIQNKWLLLIAIVLAGIVVLIYNVHIGAVREASKGRTMDVVGIRQDIGRGNRLQERYITKRTIPAANQELLGNVVPWEERQNYLVDGGKRVNRRIEAPGFLRYDDLLDRNRDKPSSYLPDDKIGLPIDIDADKSPGEFLSEGDYVNLLAVFPSTNRNEGVTREIFVGGVQVLAMGGERSTESGASRTRNYRRILVEVTPEVAVQYGNLATHLLSAVSVIVKPGSFKPDDKTGTINPQLNVFAQRAHVSRR